MKKKRKKTNQTNVIKLYEVRRNADSVQQLFDG